ncbi:iron ABC transporter permease [Streptomyces sp. NBRC 109706]|uniref:FecCD family ABC transporter permease n=1 Tax=Streptomyces sp. NBRC 109706 TaxID=1550035 RepID=UPI00082DF0E2|nr:iron ABC transporter permease [Streptomyces sp. NBRC 109706]
MTAPPRSPEAPGRAVEAAPVGERRAHPAWMVVVFGVVLLVLTALGVLVGSRPAPVADVVAALLGDETAAEHDLVWELRLPRTVLAVLVGAALGLAGAVMQALTRNPLADPGLLGVNAGAAAAVAVALALSWASSVAMTVWWAMAGAALASVVVHLLGSRGLDGGSPTKLVLAGTAISAALVALTNGLVLSVPRAFDQFRFWAVGSLEGRGTDVLLDVLPFIAVGIGGALLLGRGLNALVLGDELARTLGANLTSIRLAGLLVITLLCGAATAAAGPLAFVGLTVPHVARRWARSDERWVLWLSGLLGASLVVAADLVGRVVVRPGELEVGIVAALIGGPFFVAMVRRAERGARRRGAAA